MDKTTNTATWITPNAISNIALIKGMTGIAKYPKSSLINMEIAVPLIIFPNKRTANEIGSEISLTILIGNITKNGSKNDLIYRFNPIEMIPASWITQNVNIANENVTNI